MALDLATFAVLVGIWKYEAYRYQGVVKYPTTDAELTYEFRADGSDRLHWKLDLQDQFCEREGRYVWANNTLIDQVVSTHPENHSSCSQDPDMQVGRETRTPARIENQKLVLTLALGSENLELLFVKPSPKTP